MLLGRITARFSAGSVTWELRCTCRPQGQVIAELEESILVALVGLDRKVEGVMALGPSGSSLTVVGRPLGRCAPRHSRPRRRQNDLERMRAPLCGWRLAHVVDKVRSVTLSWPFSLSTSSTSASMETL